MFKYYVSMVLFLVTGDNWGKITSENTWKPLRCPYNPFGLSVYSAGELLRHRPHCGDRLLNRSCDVSRTSCRSVSGDQVLSWQVNATGR